MIRHAELGDASFARSRQLKLVILSGAIQLGGNRKLKIYGLLTCRSGMRMKIANRVFFADEAEAMALGYRPCGHCMAHAYGKWKNGV